MNKILGMRKWFAFVAIWIACAVFNFGAMNAEMNWVRQNKFAELHKTRRDDIGIVAFECCLLPPIQVISTLFITNFLQHGWYLGDKDVRERKEAA